MNIWKKPPVEEHWLECPNCHQPKLLKYRDDTVLVNHLAWCKWCKKESLITIGMIK